MKIESSNIISGGGSRQVGLWSSTNAAHFASPSSSICKFMTSHSFFFTLNLYTWDFSYSLPLSVLSLPFFFSLSRFLYVVFSLKFSSLSLNWEQFYHWSESLGLNLGNPLFKMVTDTILVCLFKMNSGLSFILLAGWVDTPSLCCKKRSWPSGGASAGAGRSLAGKDEGELLWGRWCPANSLRHFLIVSILKIKASAEHILVPQLLCLRNES